jgi:Flp pilus assembly protein TadD
VTSGGVGWAQRLTAGFGSLPPLGVDARPALLRVATAALSLTILTFGVGLGCTPASAASQNRGTGVTHGERLGAASAVTVSPASEPAASPDSPLVETSESEFGPGGSASSVRVAPRVQPPATESTSHDQRSTYVIEGVTNPELLRLLTLGKGALEREDYSAAIDLFRKARRLAPTAPLPLVGLAAARFGQLRIPTELAAAPGNRDIEALLRLVDEALAHAPDSGSAHLERGRLLLVLGRTQPARGALARASELLPQNAEAHSALAVVELAEGRVPQAVEGFEKASLLDPNNPERLLNWGTALFVHGDVQRAISVFHRAVALKPADARARGDLGTALLATGDVAQALPHLERAHQLAPDRATFMSNLGYAHQQLRDFAAAEGWYKKAIDVDPRLGSAWINWGTLHAARGDHAAAERAFRKALELDPRDPRALANLEDLKSLRAR